MSAKTPVRREMRVLVAGIATIASLVAAGRGVPAWYRWHDRVTQRAADVRRELDRARARVRDSGAVRDSLATRAKRMSALMPALVSRSAPAQAAGELAALIGDAAQEAGMRVASLQVRPDTVRGSGYTRVAVRADLVGDVAGLSAVLATLESGLPLLDVRELSVTQPELASAGGRPEALRVQLFVVGLAETRTGRAR
jgi:hypothetical protein